MRKTSSRHSRSLKTVDVLFLTDRARVNYVQAYPVPARCDSDGVLSWEKYVRVAHVQAVQANAEAARDLNSLIRGIRTVRAYRNYPRESRLRHLETGGTYGGERMELRFDDGCGNGTCIERAGVVGLRTYTQTRTGAYSAHQAWKVSAF